MTHRDTSDRQPGGKRILLIVDPQIDFITGSLPVPGAVTAMDSLAEYIRMEGDGYDVIAVTADRHPINHLSFKGSGGEWPRHCVEGSVGAAIWENLMEALYGVDADVALLYKGERADREEYSIFRSGSGRKTLETMLSGGDVTRLDVCGLAGDICVAQTIEDGRRLFPHLPMRLLRRFSPSLDGGKRLDLITPRLNLATD